MFIHTIAKSLNLSIDDLKEKLADPQKFTEETKKAIDTGDALIATMKKAEAGTRLQIAARERSVNKLKQTYLGEAVAIRNELGLGNYE